MPPTPAADTVAPVWGVPSDASWIRFLGQVAQISPTRIRAYLGSTDTQGLEFLTMPEALEYLMENHHLSMDGCIVGQYFARENTPAAEAAKADYEARSQAAQALSL